MTPGQRTAPQESNRDDRSKRARKTLLVISQVYVPDPASVGQHMHDAALGMAARGWRVIVYTSDAGYADPTMRYPRRELRDGVEIRRLRFSSFGKGSIALRLIGGMIFLLQAMIRGLFLRRVDSVLVATSPPMGGAAGVFFRLVRRARVCFWSMDLNPDQFVAMGHTAAGSLPVRVYDVLNRAILRHSDSVVALDRFMAERLKTRHDPGKRLAVMPPWPHIDQVNSAIPHAGNPFRTQHGLQDRFVLMYSGNVTPVHPMDTVLKAVARVQKTDPRLHMVVISGGPAVERLRKQADELGARIQVLPYQPLNTVRVSLSAADVHLVSMGDAMVGISHPCKVYGAMAVGRPILYLGPRPSHISDLMDENPLGWQVRHGDIDGAVAALHEMLAADVTRRNEMGRRAQALVRDRFHRTVLLSQFCDLIDGTLAPAPANAGTGATPVAAATLPEFNLPADAVASQAPAPIDQPEEEQPLVVIATSSNGGNGNGNGHRHEESARSRSVPRRAGAGSGRR